LTNYLELLAVFVTREDEVDLFALVVFGADDIGCASLTEWPIRIGRSYSELSVDEVRYFPFGPFEIRTPSTLPCWASSIA
jgi:hypothetical protein